MAPGSVNVAASTASLWPSGTATIWVRFWRIPTPRPVSPTNPGQILHAGSIRSVYLNTLAPFESSLRMADSRAPQLQNSSQNPSQNPPQSAPQNAPQNGPLPFFVVGQSNQPPSQQQSHYPPNDTRSRNASGNQVPTSSDPYHHRPQSTYDNPQELGTSQYASPTEARPQSYPPPHQPRPEKDDYSPSVYSPADGEVAQQPPQQQQQQYQPYSPGPQQSQQQNPPHQSAPRAPSPNPGPTPYPVLNTGPPAGVGYQAYHAPPSQKQQQQQGYVANAGGDPNDFYR